jgi:CDP-paratose 2-epimerase
VSRAALDGAAQDGVDGARRRAASLNGSVPQEIRSDKPILITGGAGFVGTNLAHRLLGAGRSVIVFDNLSRPGVEQNLRWLAEQHPSGLDLVLDDVRRARPLRDAARRSAHVFHFAAQVAVTSSLVRPRHDFSVNVRGTLNLLESLRGLADPPSVVFTSTNKVYGECQDVALARKATRYEPLDPAMRAHGIGEHCPLDFRSPYGCSKGAADQYVLDYARSFGLHAVVFRMSCIYGPHQFGTEDQGWVAHFLMRAVRGEALTIYGDGRQVRDVLFVEDLVDALLLAQVRAGALAGHAFNIGGGPANAVSLLELVALIGRITGERPPLEFGPWRTGDQRYYVSDARRFQAATGWAPRVSVAEGLEQLHAWLVRSKVAAGPAIRGRTPGGAAPVRAGRAPLHA